MAKIRIVGDSSGYVEIAAPSAAGNNTLELPSSGTRLTAADSSGNLNVSGILTVSAGSTSIPSISPSGDSNTGIFFPSADTIAFGEGGVESARFDSNGRLGIGTANPSEALHVLRATNGGQFAVDNTGQEYTSINLKNTGTRKGVLEWSNTGNILSLAVDGAGSPTGSLHFETNSLSRMIIDSSGRVTTPYQPAANWVISANTSTFVRSVSIKRDANNNVSSVAAGNGSSHGSVGRFTAPVAGVYLITIRGASSTISGSNELLSVYGSWSTTTNVLNPTNEVLDLRCTPLINDGIGWACTLYLSANDYWELDWYRPAPTTYVGTTLWDISTILLG
jgi:hypothetical protein